MTAPQEKAIREALPVAEHEKTIRDLCAGSVEWRVCTDDGAYCMHFGRDNSLSPEREANEWLAEHQRKYPERFMPYKVRRVVVQSELQQEALGLLAQLAEMRAEVERLRAELDARDGLLREVEKYMCEQPAVWGVLGLLKRIRAALDASRLALKEAK